MDVPDSWVAAGAVALVIAVVGWFLTARGLSRRLRRLKSERQSLATRHGQTLEQFAPFLESWPWDPKRFRFIGSPVDGIQFTDDELIVVEVKSQDGRLTPEQQRAKALVAAGRVRWQEVRIR